MTHSRIFIIPELLEQILHFLLIDKSLYPSLYVSRLWCRCGAPILWKCIELKGNEVDDKSRLERFLKIVCGGGRKLIYGSHLTHLKISYYHSLSKKIKGIARMFPNIIYLDFKNGKCLTSKALKLIAESYPNLKYLNISVLRCEGLADHISIVRGYGDKGLCAIANSWNI